MKKKILKLSKMKTFFILLITNLFTFVGTAQNTTSDKTISSSITNNLSTEASQNPDNKTGVALYLQNTERSIYADRKRILANHIKEENVDLLNAITLQEYAMKLYKSGKEKDALICSSKARKIAVKLLEGFVNVDYASHYDSFEMEEAQLAEINNDTSTVDIWLAKARQ
jgi:hypothetical protein